MSTSEDDAVRMRELVERVGGLVNLTDLARRWGVSRSRAHQLAKHSDFPAPIVVVGDDTMALYAVVEVDAWRATPRRIGRPPES